MSTQFTANVNENFIEDIKQSSVEEIIMEQAKYGNITLDKDGKIIPFANIQNESVNFVLDPSYFDIPKIKSYWYNLFETDSLAEDETIRIVYFAVDPNESSKIKPADKKKQFKIEGTYKDQIRSIDQLIDTIKLLQYQNKDKILGISIGAAIFKYTPVTDPELKVGPGINSLDRIKTMVVDIDCYYHANKSQKDRINFTDFNFKTTQFVAIQIFNYMCNLLSTKSAPLILPHKVYCTGGGFQIHLKFDEFLTKIEAKKIFDMYKQVLASDRFLVTGIIDSPIVGLSILDFYADIDATFADISHVQRMGGMKNQKYQYMPLDITDIFGEHIGNRYVLKDESKRSNFNVKTLSSTEIYEVLDNYFDSVTYDNTNLELPIMNESLKNLIDTSSRTQDEKKFLKNKIDQILNTYSIYSKSAFGYNLTKQDYLSLTGMVIKSDKVIAEATSVGDASLNDILFKINGNIALNILRDELDFRQEFGNLVKANCPFHDENHASFAIYKNENGKTILMDFHDNETYNMVTFWMKYKEVDKNTAINQLVSRAGITFTGRESKSLQKVLEKSSVNDLIKEIDLNTFIYYRLATKQKYCIVRHIDSGESFLFDGSKMLADHVLDNQIKQKNLDPEFRALFHIAFCEEVLIDAFEEFSPGMPSSYTRDFIQFVNTWIPGKNYKEIHKLAQNFEAMDIDSALNLIKTNTPWMYKFLLQITQKGNLKYFLNWLVASSQFRIMPILPVLTSNFGTGKNVFVEEVLNFYFNKEYVHVMSSDRVQSQFNSQLETCSMLVLDEGDFSKTKEVDNLKFLTGNTSLTIEKKGIDATKKKKWFNTIMLTNGESPITHPINERRFTYYRLDVPLHITCERLGINIEQFLVNIRKELVDFWAILTKTQVVTEWAFQADKSPQYFKQILMMHPFGKMVIKFLEDQWGDLSLQMNESVDDEITQTNNIKMINEIARQFQEDGKLNLTIINKYMKSLNYKHWQSIQNFIQVNHLKEHGFDIEMSPKISVVLDTQKIKTSITMLNNLWELFPDHFKEEEKFLLAIKDKESNNLKKAIKTNPAAVIANDPKIDSIPSSGIDASELQQFINPTAGVVLPGMDINLNTSGAPTLPSL
jgi:hypothetical protein